MHPNDRKKIKKQNLKDAKSHFKYKVVIDRTDRIALREWFVKHRYRSWKEKGLAGDYFTQDHRTFWFKDQKISTHFLLAMK